MIHLTALLLTAVTVAAAIVRWDDERKRPTWVWRRRTRSGTRARRWAIRAVLLGIAAVILLAPLVLGPTAGANPFSCAEAPQVDVPGKGLTAALDPGAATPGAQGNPSQAYGQYGYAGQVWNTYDLGCTASLSDPLSPTMTALSNGLFNVSKDFAAATNGLHYLLLNPHAFDWLNSLVAAISGTMFRGVFGVWVELALLLFGAILLWHAKTADNAGAAKRGLWGLLGFWMAASAALMPVTYNDFFRQNLVQMTGQAQAGFIDPNQANTRNVMPDAVMKTVVYDNWLTGEFGAPDNPQAKQYGPQLLDAQACSKVEQASNTCDTKKKQGDFDALASKIKDENKTYTTLQGSDYWSRVSASVVAAYEGFYIYLFQLIAKVIIVLSLVMIAVLIFLLPVTGLLGMLSPDTLRSNLKTFGTAFINSIMMGLLGGLHTRLVIYVTHSAMPFLVQSLFLLLSTILMLMIARPIKRIKSMVSATLDVANASFPDSYRRMYPRPHPYRPQRPSDEFFDQQRSRGIGDTWWEPGKQQPRWSATRGSPEEQPAAASSGLVPTDVPGTIYTRATREASGSQTRTTAGNAARSATAATTMAGAGGALAGALAGRALASSGTERTDSRLAGQLGEAPALSRGDTGETTTNPDRRALPEGPQHTQPHPQPPEPPANPTGQDGTGTAAPRSSFGLIESEPDVYRPTATEAEHTGDRPIIEAHQDQHGTWYVPSESGDTDTNDAPGGPE